VIYVAPNAEASATARLVFGSSALPSRPDADMKCSPGALALFATACLAPLITSATANMQGLVPTDKQT